MNLKMSTECRESLAMTMWLARARNVWLLAIAFCVGAATIPARADYPVAPDVVVFCEPTLQHAVTDVAGLWRKETGVPVRIFTSPTWALLQQIAHHARDDVVIGEGDTRAAEATEQHLIKAETLQRLWRNRLIVAALAKAGPGNLAGLAGKEPIAIVDPAVAVAGAEGEKALLSLGLWTRCRLTRWGSSIPRTRLFCSNKARSGRRSSTPPTRRPTRLSSSPTDCPRRAIAQ